ncbi:MAG: 5-formyltetrahydrofolate cyclo-ligase [Lentisphaerae bacterium]|nr:5-formyltetrahydrofolate cyclo-ligase [Lentisphaerota bacterium]
MSEEAPELLAAKQALREAIRARRKGLSAPWIAAASEAIAERLLALPEFRAAGRVACYVSMAGEVSTERIMAACHEQGRAVCVPAFDRSGRQYGFVDYPAGAEVVRGPLGIPQPAGARAVPTGEVDFVVVPGLAFDAAGGRLGHGGGHYDRMLTAGGRPFKAAVAFDFQVVERVPMGVRDVRMDAVVTSTAVLRPSSTGKG